MCGLATVDVSCEINYHRWHLCSYIIFVTCFVVLQILKFLLTQAYILYVKHIASDIILRNI
jgi:hypothetical protein